jgi:hypothetical protein
MLYYVRYLKTVGGNMDKSEEIIAMTYKLYLYGNANPDICSINNRSCDKCKLNTTSDGCLLNRLAALARSTHGGNEIIEQVRKGLI